MENVVYQDSPLAAYLEGEGKVEHEWVASEGTAPEAPASTQPSFAPHGLSKLQTKLRDKLPQPCRVSIPSHGIFRGLHATWQGAVNSTFGKSDNGRFLEQFRYIIVASQLLSDRSGQGSFKPASTCDANLDVVLKQAAYGNASASVIGASVAALCAFGMAWIVRWAGNVQSRSFGKGRIALAVSAFVAVAILFYAYARQRWLQHLRRQAVDAASALVTNALAFDASTHSALTLIQEVELVSRGYRISSPLPPITRLEEKDQIKRCSRLRRELKAAYAETVPAFAEACGVVRKLVEQEDDLEKYFDIYEINNQDLQEASRGYSESEFDDLENLKPLSIFSHRLSTLRRVVLCSLLALPADDENADLARWKTAVEVMNRLAFVAGRWSQKLNEILVEEEQFVSPPTPKRPLTPGRERLRTHVRKLGSLSHGIRGLQAKMLLLREETNRTLEQSDNCSDPVSDLMAQYESIGADLRSLMQAWEAGKSSLAVNIDKHERRVSQASSGLRSPAPSLGGTTAVDGGSPTEALRALNGEIFTHSTTSSVSAPESTGSDEEIFEAIAIPRTRNRLSREERMVKIQEDRVKQASLRERREASKSMLKELESVIHLQRSKSAAGRVTSV